jgi:S1-C subfamily serine protease
MEINDKLKKNINNSVVRIIAENISINWNMPYILDVPTKGQGTGFFIDKKGHILTCCHVVEGAKNVYIEIPALSSEKYNCEIIGICGDFDIALLKVKGYKPITFLPLGNSDTLKVGQEVQVVGYPASTFLRNNANNIKFTKGIISGQQNGMIQTDSTINPGNSGGPLFCNNKVIGINSMKLIGKSIENVGFAVPINHYKIIKDNFKEKIIYRPNFLFEYNNTSKDLLNAITNNKISEGIIVSKIYDKSILKKTNIKEGTIIIAINNYNINNYGVTDKKWIDTFINMNYLMNKFQNNEIITIKCFNKNKIETIKVKLKPTILPIRTLYPSFENIDYFIICGIIFMNLTYNHVVNNYSENISVLCNVSSIDNILKPKIIVSFVIPNSEANIINNIVETDIITKINDINVSNIKELKKAIEKTLNINNKEYIKIESNNGKYLLMQLKKCIEQDILFSNIYKYPLTDFHLKYIEKYSLK